MQLVEFLECFREPITAAMVRQYPPLYDLAARRSGRFDTRRLGRRPLGAQADAIRAAALSLGRHASTTIVGEMGTGKSFCGAAAAYLAGCRRVLVLAPPHLVRKWEREIRLTVPGARVVIVRRIDALERVVAASPAGGPPQFVVLSREAAKLGYRWRPAAVSRPARSPEGVERDESGEPLRYLCCPRCGAPVADDDGVPLTLGQLGRKKGRCRGCGEALWQADPAGPRRYPLADYIGARLRGHFDLLIADEVHEYKGRGSAQGLAAGELAGACAKTLTLTGTIFGGYASTLFHLLWRFDPTLRGQFGWGDETKWVARYGIVKRIAKRGDDHRADGRHSKRRVHDVRTVECPGVSPAMLSHLLPHTVFLRLADVSADLPPFAERVLLCPLDRAARDGRPSQARAYEALANKSKRLLGGYLQALLSYPDACTRAEQLVDAVRGCVVAAAPALPAAARYPKERELLALARRERERGRRLLVYVSHTASRDLTPRLRALLEEAGLRVAVLKAGTVAAERREEWIAARVAEGHDVLITNPKCVATGLDLFAYPAIAFYELEYSVYVMRQASRRSWRIGQRQPVEATYLAYRGTLQAEALALVAAKVRAALLVEGELPEDGLAALEGEEQDQLLALARRLVDPDAAADSSLEALFAQARDADAAANGFLDAELADAWADAAPVPVPEDIGPPAAPTDEPALAPLPLPLPAPVVSPEPYASDAGAKVLRFEDLLAIAAPRRTAGRRKPAPAGQLALFG